MTASGKLQMETLVKNAFVLGAGLGTRLQPLTSVRPKPLMPVFGKPLITFALDHLRSIGVENFVINTHHLPVQFYNFFREGEYAGCPVKLVHEPVLLETGGGIKNAEKWIGREPFIVYSGDILTDIDLRMLVEEHFRSKNDVTLALRKTGLAAGIALREGRIVDIRSKYGHPGEYDFANVSVWNADIYQRIPEAQKISFVPVLLDWIGEGGRIGGVVLDERQWFNIGSRAEYLAVHRHIGGKSWKPDYVDVPDWPQQISPAATIAPSARFGGVCSVGAGCAVGGGVLIEDSILWPGAKIDAGTQLRGCIVAGSLFITGRHDNVDFT